MKAFYRSQLFLALRRIYFKVWWIDVLYPLFLCFLLFWCLSYLLYSGQKHRRVSSQIETRLIYWSLWTVGPRTLESASPFLTVSLDEHDFQTLNQLSIHEHRDTSLINYAFLLDKLLDLGTQNIFIHWQPDAFPHGSHYEPFFPLIDKAKVLGSEIYFVVHPTLMTSFPTRFREHASLLEADPCDSSLQILCVYDKVWNRWVMQKIAKHFWKDKRSPRIFSPISQNLPPQSQAYLLYYNSYMDFVDFSFRDIIEWDQTSVEAHKSFFKGRTVFVGNSLVQGRTGMMKSSDINRVKTVLDPLYSSARRTGTPLHKYWAQHAQMFHDNAMIGIVPEWVSISLALLLVLTIILILHRLGAMYSLATFLIFCCVGPAFNIFAIRYLHTYVPIFDALYAGFLSFLMATFAKLSIESFYHWRLRIQQKSDLELLSAKNHFLSLLSHNLNTPVAKMQGILSAVESYAQAEDLRRDLETAQKLVSTIQLSIRSVLVTTALEEKELNAEAFVLGTFLQSFRESVWKTLKRLGIDVQLQLEENELSNIPVRFDRRALTMGIASLLVLLKEHFQVKELTLRFSLSEDGVLCKIACDSVLPPDFLKHIQENTPHDLLGELASTVLSCFLETYKERILFVV